MKRKLSLLLAVSVLLAVLAGCGGKTGPVTVRLNEVTHSVFYATWVATA